MITTIIAGVFVAKAIYDIPKFVRIVNECRPCITAR